MTKPKTTKSPKSETLEERKAQVRSAIKHSLETLIKDADAVRGLVLCVSLNPAIRTHCPRDGSHGTSGYTLAFDVDGQADVDVEKGARDDEPNAPGIFISEVTVGAAARIASKVKFGGGGLFG